MTSRFPSYTSTATRNTAYVLPDAQGRIATSFTCSPTFFSSKITAHEFDRHAWKYRSSWGFGTGSGGSSSTIRFLNIQSMVESTTLFEDSVSCQRSFGKLTLNFGVVCEVRFSLLLSSQNKHSHKHQVRTLKPWSFRYGAVQPVHW